MRKFFLIAVLGFVLRPAFSFAEDAASELEMFSSSEVATQVAAAAPAAEEKKTVGFSGEALSVLEDIVYSSAAGNPFNSYIVGNLMLDARLKNGVKAFANMETGYYSKTRETTSALREAFLDFNINRRVYFRTGKQVLQWGRCYLWNPTDLINAEKKTFVRKIGYRDGAYGVKFHIPFGTDYNIYGFLDTGGASEDRDLGGALKFEFLTGKTEMAFSGWAKRNRRPVFGYDLSSRLGEVDIAGEVSVARRDNTRFMREESGVLYTYLKDDGWVTKAAGNFSKGFRLGNFNDRLTVAAEFFYNQTGYTKSPFRDGAVYAFSGPLAALLPAGTKKEFLLYNGLYDPNYLSRYYGAAFISVTRFIITDMTLNVNYIRNLSDDSGMLSTGVAYKTLNDFSAGLLVNSYLGPRNREYTFSGAKLAAQLTFGVAF
ncbi:MAG: hypothetical protein KKH28_10195 [Elusimicrobia bacterium]|nr:hypothetical protein [Elusimicrobiota bacterium]